MRSSHWPAPRLWTARMAEIGRAGGVRAARRAGGPAASCARTGDRAAARHADAPALHRGTARRAAGRRCGGAVGSALRRTARRGCASGCGRRWPATARWCRCSTCCAPRRCRPRAASQLRSPAWRRRAPYDLLIARGTLEAEIACEVVSAEEGRLVQRGAWSHLADRVDADLRAWLADLSRALPAEDDAAAGLAEQCTGRDARPHPPSAGDRRAPRSR